MAGSGGGEGARWYAYVRVMEEEAVRGAGGG